MVYLIFTSLQKILKNLKPDADEKTHIGTVTAWAKSR